jgi:glycosyltransferase involved in cell wall biosynthesis
MKILILTPRFFPEIGGVEKHVLCISNELSNSISNVRILTATNKQNLDPEELISRLKVNRIYCKDYGNVWINALLRRINIWVVLIKKFKLLQESAIIQLNDFETFIWILPFIIFLKNRLYITFHGFEGTYPVQQTAKTIRKIAERLTKGNICVGKFIEKWYGTHSQYVTIGAVDPSKSLTVEEKNEVVFVGRLEKDTNILELIETLNILKTNYGIELPLHVCGNGFLWKEINEKTKKYNLKVFMHGFDAFPQKYLFPCRFSFSTGYLSILESMICGKIVLSIYTNPLKRDYLFSIPHAESLMLISSSPTILAEQLYCSIVNPKSTQLRADRAKSFAAQQTWRKLADQYLSLWRLS